MNSDLTNNQVLAEHEPILGLRDIFRRGKIILLRCGSYTIVSCIFAGGVDVKEMLEHSELTARIPNEGLDFEGPGTTRITSTETRSSSNEKWGREREGQTASSF